MDEASDQGQALWVVLHERGLNVVDIESGTETNIVKVSSGDEWEFAKTGRQLADNAKFFVHRSRRNRRMMTLARVADAETLRQVDSLELLKMPHWDAEVLLCGAGTYCLTLARQNRSCSIVRVDLYPSPRVTASQDLGPLAHNIFATPDPGGIAAAIPSDDGTGAGVRSLRVFDHRLRRQHTEMVRGPMLILSAVDRPEPLLAVRSSAGDPGVRFPGRPYWMVAELVRETGTPNQAVRSNLRTKIAANHRIMAAAFSPDAQWLVTSRVDTRPTLAVWSVATGQVHQEFPVDGGRHNLPGHQVITRMAFSNSGRYLCASDYGNAYLLNFRDLMEKSQSP